MRSVLRPTALQSVLPRTTSSASPFRLASIPHAQRRRSFPGHRTDSQLRRHSALLVAELRAADRRRTVRWIRFRSSPTSSPQDTIANSNYNSVQANLEKRFSNGLQLQAAYTFSKSFDQASSFEDKLNPFDPRRTSQLVLVRRPPAIGAELLLTSCRSRSSTGVAGQGAQRLGGFGHHTIPERIPDSHCSPSTTTN